MCAGAGSAAEPLVETITCAAVSTIPRVPTTKPEPSS